MWANKIIPLTAWRMGLQNYISPSFRAHPCQLSVSVFASLSCQTPEKNRSLALYFTFFVTWNPEFFRFRDTHHHWFLFFLRRDKCWSNWKFCLQSRLTYSNLLRRKAQFHASVHQLYCLQNLGWSQQQDNNSVFPWLLNVYSGQKCEKKVWCLPMPVCTLIKQWTRINWYFSPLYLYIVRVVVKAINICNSSNHEQIWKRKHIDIVEFPHVAIVLSHLLGTLAWQGIAGHIRCSGCWLLCKWIQTVCCLCNQLLYLAVECRQPHLHYLKHICVFTLLQKWIGVTNIKKGGSSITLCCLNSILRMYIQSRIKQLWFNPGRL